MEMWRIVTILLFCTAALAKPRDNYGFDGGSRQDSYAYQEGKDQSLALEKDEASESESADDTSQDYAQFLSAWRRREPARMPTASDDLGETASAHAKGHKDEKKKARSTKTTGYSKKKTRFITEPLKKSNNEKALKSHNVLSNDELRNSDYDYNAEDEADYGHFNEKSSVNRFEMQDEDKLGDGYEQVRERRGTKDEFDKKNKDSTKTTKSTKSTDSITTELPSSIDGLAIDITLEQVSDQPLEVIQRHIHDLLSSLPLSKRELIKESFGKDKDVEKRDITKKAEIQTKEKHENSNARESISKQQESSELAGDKSTESATVSNNAEISSLIESVDIIEGQLDAAEEKSECSNMISEISDEVAKLAEQSKLDSEEAAKLSDDKNIQKRETNLNEYSGAESDNESAEHSDFDNNDENELYLSENASVSAEDEHHDESREEMNNISEEHKSMNAMLAALEESFPAMRTSECEEQNNDLAPLVRVKRTRAESEGRPEPGSRLRADTDEEDDEEGTEFEDDGFLDRVARFGRQKAPDAADEEREPKEVKAAESVELVKFSIKVPTPAPRVDLSNIGSDTDNVLGGADDNVMASGSRIARQSDSDSGNELDSTASDELSAESQAAKEVEVHKDHEESFGGLPKNYEGMELSRYKRIRRGEDDSVVAASR